MGIASKFTDEQKMEIALELISGKMSHSEVCRKWDIGSSYAYKLKDRAMELLRKGMGRAIRKGVLLKLLILCVLSLTGCIPISEEKLSFSIAEQELSDHVHFLAQPALKGRKPKTRGSAAVRRYLKTRFEDYGLVSWPGAEDYEQPFSFGTNVIGVLPGSDPSLADEFVILAAHYDHVGKTKDGVLLGACDNASGVAALLEIAEQFSLAKEKPKRSICFASFDCEEYMLLGALIFSCQKDFEKQKIAAVVNVDMIGRDFLDVVEDSLFVAGTEKYPQLRTQMVQAKIETGLNIFPLGTKIVGPRGDHIVFENLDVPVLFFCCGLNKDYHKPTDTAEKLDYSGMEKSTKVIAKTVEMLANTRQIEKPILPQTGDKMELRDLKFILEKINANHETLKINAEQREGLQKLGQKMQRLLDEEEYTIKQQKEFAKQAIEALIPVFIVSDDTTEQNNAWRLKWYLDMYELYTEHSEFLIEYSRNIIKQMLEDKPGLFNMPEFKFNMFLVSDDGLSFIEKQDGQCQLDMIVLKTSDLDFQPKKSLFKRRGMHFPSMRHKIIDFAGTKDQVIDYCLLQWRKKSTDEFYSQTWGHILSVVAGYEYGETYEDWLQWRLETQVAADEKQWLSNLLEGDDQRMAYYAGKKMHEKDGRTSKELQAIIKDPNATPDAREQAIWELNDSNRENMLMLVETLDDETPRVRHNWKPRYMDESYPLANHRAVEKARKNWEKQQEKDPGTIGDIAESMLAVLANRDPAKKNDVEQIVVIKHNFGKDAKAWRKWIKANVK